VFAVWRRYWGSRGFGIEDTSSRLGADSIVSIQLLSRARKRVW